SANWTAKPSGEPTRREFLKSTAALGLLALAPPLTTGCGSSGDGTTNYSDIISDMTAVVQKRMAANAYVKGLSLALVDDQRVVWAQGFGYADAEAKVPATADTLYEIGSVSKVFTACLVLQLVDTGKVNLDDPLIKYIPGFSVGPPLGGYPESADRPITIRSMLTHHSGIPGDLWNGTFGKAHYPDFNTRLLKTLSSDNAHYPPNFFLMYNNTAVSLLATVIEAASGETFASRSDAFFQTLGMNHTSFFRDSQAVAGGPLAKGYLQGKTYGPYYNNTVAAGSMISSVSDMARFIQMMNARGRAQGGRVLKAETVETMITRQNGSIPLDFDFPLGFIWKLYDPELAYAGRFCEHSGDAMIFESMLKILTEHNLGMIVLTNAQEGNPLHAEIARDALARALKRKRGIAKPSGSPEPPYSTEASWTAAQLKAIDGIYSTLDDASGAGTSPCRSYSRIEAVIGGLLWKKKGEPLHHDWESAKVIVPRENGWFSEPTSQEYQYEFREMQGRMVMIEHHQGQAHLLAERYVPVVPIPEKWAGRVGNYGLANLDPADWTEDFVPVGLNLISKALSLQIEGDVLVLRCLDGVYQGPYVVSPVSDTVGYMPGGGRNLAGSVRAVPFGGEEQLQFLGLIYRRI
ncbi:MAG: serine hydrolase domain-containing protein, partial [Syntrophales bacterium]